MNYLRAAAARTQAKAMIAELELHRPGAYGELAISALTKLRTWTEFTVQIIPDDQTGPGCSVAGTYMAGPPPVLAVARSASTARRDFTALHELGHHLQQNSFALQEAFDDQPDRGQMLEDAACDAFAAEILLPAPLVEAHLPAAGPAAADIVDLWQAGGASRMAVCVSASQHLPAPGHVLLLDHAGHLAFAASHGLPRLQRGSDQSSAPIIRQALTTRGRVEGRTRLRYRDGIVGDELYVQTAPMDGYLLAVLVTDTAPWRSLAPSTPTPGPQARSWICETCGHEYDSYAPTCPECRVPTCPECGRCACAPKIAQLLCPGCFLVHPPGMFAPGSDRCRDCV